MDISCCGRHISLLLLMLKVNAINHVDFIGCVLDQPARTMPNYQLTTQDMTNDLCGHICCQMSTNMTFMGTQDSEQCFCDIRNGNAEYVSKSETECRSPCKGNSSQYCGGNYRLSVYKLDCTLRPSKQQTQITLDVTQLEKQVEELRTENSIYKNWTSALEIQLEELKMGMSISRNTTATKEVQLKDLQTKMSVLRNYTSTLHDELEELKTKIQIKRNTTAVLDTKNILTKRQIDIQMEKIKKEIAVDKKNTSLYKSKKKCASDNRKSARNLGIMGIIVLILPVLLIVGNDFMNVFKRTA